MYYARQARVLPRHHPERVPGPPGARLRARGARLCTGGARLRTGGARLRTGVARARERVDIARWATEKSFDGPFRFGWRPRTPCETITADLSSAEPPAEFSFLPKAFYLGRRLSPAVGSPGPRQWR